MKNLQSYLNGLPTKEQIAYAGRCKTTVGYLRKAISKGQRLGEALVIKLDRESGGKVRCEELRPDVDWAYLRATSPAANDAHGAQAAQQGVANA
jgi:DNA-binding transcriptional regulator YdaS (Cro superfamily)